MGEEHLEKQKVELFAVPILGVEVTPVFHWLSFQRKVSGSQTNISILQRDKYATMCENLKLIHCS